mgnify:CR=1 FL=1
MEYGGGVAHLALARLKAFVFHESGMPRLKASVRLVPARIWVWPGGSIVNSMAQDLIFRSGDYVGPRWMVSENGNGRTMVLELFPSMNQRHPTTNISVPKFLSREFLLMFVMRFLTGGVYFRNYISVIGSTNIYNP